MLNEEVGNLTDQISIEKTAKIYGYPYSLPTVKLKEVLKQLGCNYPEEIVSFKS